MSDTPLTIYDLGRTAFNQQKYADAADILARAITAAESAKDNTTLVRALSLHARAYLIRSFKEEGRPSILRAAELATPDDPIAWSAYLGVKGRFEWKDNNLEQAKATFTQWFDFCVTHDMTDVALDAVHMIAIVAPPREQIEWHRKGIALAERAVAAGKTSGGWLGPMYNNLGWVHFELKEYDQALEALQRARTHHHKHSNELSRLCADIFVAKVLRVMGRAEEAEPELKKAFAWASEIYTRDKDAGERLGNCYEELAELDILAGRTTDAIDKLKKAHALITEAGVGKWGPEELTRLTNRIASIA